MQQQRILCRCPPPAWNSTSAIAGPAGLRTAGQLTARHGRHYGKSQLVPSSLAAGTTSTTRRHSTHALPTSVGLRADHWPTTRPLHSCSRYKNTRINSRTMYRRHLSSAADLVNCCLLSSLFALICTQTLNNCSIRPTFSFAAKLFDFAVHVNWDLFFIPHSHCSWGVPFIDAWLGGSQRAKTLR